MYARLARTRRPPSATSIPALAPMLYCTWSCRNSSGVERQPVGTDTLAALSAGLRRTPARGWAVALLSRLQVSSIMLTSFTLGVFLPFIRQELQLSPLQAGLLQGVSWVTAALMALPSLEVLSFEFPGIRPRGVAVIASLVKTFSGLGCAMGPVVTGLVTQLTGSRQTGFVVLCGLTGVGVMAGLLYPSSLQSTEAPAGSCR